jgi:hypothetical protein
LKFPEIFPTCLQRSTTNKTNGLLDIPETLGRIFDLIEEQHIVPPGYLRSSSWVIGIRVPFCLVLDECVIVDDLDGAILQ